MDRWIIPLSDYVARLKRAFDADDKTEISHCMNDFVISDHGALATRSTLLRVVVRELESTKASPAGMECYEEDFLLFHLRELEEIESVPLPILRRVA
jgi:hypothetical protein